MHQDSLAGNSKTCASAKVTPHCFGHWICSTLRGMMATISPASDPWMNGIGSHHVIAVQSTQWQFWQVLGLQSIHCTTRVRTIMTSRSQPCGLLHPHLTWKSLASNCGRLLSNSNQHEVKSIKTVAVQNKNKKDALIENLQEEPCSTAWCSMCLKAVFLIPSFSDFGSQSADVAE